MPENMPHIPSGAIPPKKETGKVQPKKETVRINLPPKPSAAPTIKLPTLPPGGPGTGGMAPSAAAPAAAPAPQRATSAPVSQRAAQAPARQAPAPSARSVNALDMILAVAAMIVGLACVGSAAYLLWIVPG